ncbi:metal ABC transporter permease [Entomobacter blattae]|uniref:High-affinity zinc uptake system membrane protein ZnuB n=1 Tax=Entomobacter blattae TaxID=2762277 RepID=A0A7H1NPS3_9PROT|nr:metal ABC transporter permease [Entomobacter blattae]QNT77783.1 High-affinity zinc uptake system membrane protein ZnuB [Entomobacter blattae]
MRYAFLAATVISVLCGITGYFLVIRQQNFSAHALAHIGFAGATGAALVGISSFLGIITFTLLGGMVIGGFDSSSHFRRDIITGLTLSFSLGLGTLFLYFYPGYATKITSLMFGNIFGMSKNDLFLLYLLALVCGGMIIIAFKPLLYTSLLPEISRSQGFSPRFWSIIFLSLLSITVSECAQITGILLVFTLLVGPAASALNLSVHPMKAIGLSVLMALGCSWGGIALSWYSDWPVSFWISFLSLMAYLLSLLFMKVGRQGYFYK